jgi:hypothetical protein
MENSDVFEEWNSYAKKRELLPRDMDLEAIIKNSDTKIIALTGIRRSGKSSLLMLLTQKLTRENKRVGYVNVEDSRLSGSQIVLDQILKWFGGDGYLLLDEITNADDWAGWLSRNHEFLKGRLHLIVSSSHNILSTPPKALRGRILTYEVFPLSFQEFLRFKKIEIEKTTISRGETERALNEYLKYGGFPEVVLTTDNIDKIKILNSYFRDIVALDVADASRQEITVVDTFSKYVVEANNFSASKCLNFLKSLGYKIGKVKILELEKYTQDSYLFFFTKILSFKLKDRSQYPRKAYLGDLGFYYGTTGKTDIGKLFENLVFLELKRKLKNQSEIFYWKNAAGFETDFITRKGNSITSGIQAAYEITDKTTEKRETRGLIECSKTIKPKNLLILTNNIKKTETIDGTKIRYIPIYEWLSETV